MGDTQSPAWGDVTLGGFPYEIQMLIAGKLNTEDQLALKWVNTSFAKAFAGEYGAPITFNVADLEAKGVFRKEDRLTWLANKVEQFSWVVGINLADCDIAASDLSALLNKGHLVESLQSLDLTHCYQITRDTQRLSILTEFRNLRSLNLHDSSITDTGLEHVAQLTQLTSLDLGDNVQHHGHRAGARCPTHAAHQPELVVL